jgi:hypothetical protein
MQMQGFSLWGVFFWKTMTITCASNEVHKCNVFVVYKKKHYTVIFFIFLIDFNFVILILYYYMTLIAQGLSFAVQVLCFATHGFIFFG